MIRKAVLVFALSAAFLGLGAVHADARGCSVRVAPGVADTCRIR